jgi:DNA-binding response OmpR family regulator
MRMLVADDNTAFREFVSSTVSNSLGYEVVHASTGAEALRLALSQPIPDILLLDWVMPELSGTQVCKLVRASSLPTQPYIAFATSRVRTEEIVAALSAGADDLMTKPISPNVLIARLSVPKSRIATQSPKRLRDEIIKACERGSGELAITSGELTAKVLIHEGKIAWAHLADAADNLFDALAPEAGIDPDTAQSIVRECKNTGKSLSETLVSWGLIDRARLRNALREWIERKLEAICKLPSPQALFLPVQRTYSRDVLFDLTEVAPAAWDIENLRDTQPPNTISQTPTLIPSRGWDAAFQSATDETLNVDELLQKCEGVQGVTAVALINRTMGTCLGRRGAEMDSDVVWSMLRCVGAAERTAKVEESIVTTDSHFHFATLLASRPDVFVYALVDSTQNLAAARYGLRKVLRENG